MQVLATFFGKTLLVKCEPHNMLESETPDEILWCEDPTDLYALLSTHLRDKKVAVVWRDDWLKVSRKPGDTDFSLLCAAYGIPIPTNPGAIHAQPEPEPEPEH